MLNKSLLIVGLLAAASAFANAQETTAVSKQTYAEAVLGRRLTEEVNREILCEEQLLSAKNDVAEEQAQVQKAKNSALEEMATATAAKMPAGIPAHAGAHLPVRPNEVIQSPEIVNPSPKEVIQSPETKVRPNEVIQSPEVPVAPVPPNEVIQSPEVVPQK